jgi:hypothetical protein
MANAKISDNSIFVPKTNITDIVGLAGYDNSGNVKISGAQLKASVLSGAIQTIAATSPLERTTGNDTVISMLEASTTQDGYLSSSNFIAFSDADGTVKSVSGTGTVSGITLSGTVTTSGNLELGGTLTIPSANIISFLGYTPYNNTNPSGFTSNTGTVSNLVFSSPLTGGTITSTGTVGITAASTNSDGYLTQGDWNTFNSKTSSDGTVTSVGGTGTVSGISLSGTVATSGNLTLGGALSLTSLNITNGLGFTPYNNTNPSGFTANTGTVTSVTTTAPLSGSVTSTGSLSITKANTNTNGYLSSTDWNTFDGKTSFAEPGIFSGGGTPTLATDVTGTEIRTLIGAGTGNGDVTADSTTDFTNKTGSNSQWTNDENYTNNVGTVTANNTIVFTNKSGNISQWTNDAGYITSAGDNTFVTTAALSSGTLTLTRNDSVTIDASGFLQIGATSSDALAGDTTTITPAQATAISDNSLKTSFPGFGAVSGKALEGDTVIPTVNDGKLSISVDGTVTDFTANQSGDTSVTIVTGDSDNFYVTAASYSAGTLTLTRNGSLANVTATGFLQIGTSSTTALAGNTTIITTTQASEITANTAKVTDTGIPAIITVADGTLSFANSNVTGATVRSQIGAGTGNGDVTASSTTTFTNKSGSNSQWTNDEGYTTNTGTTTADNTQTFTNKSGSNSQWTNDEGYTTNAGTVTPSSTDTFTNKSGSNSQWTNDEGYITSAVNYYLDGITKSGNILTFSVSGTTDQTYTFGSNAFNSTTIPTNNNQLTNGAGYTTNTGTTTASNTQTFTNKTGNISQWTNDENYSTTTGTVTPSSTDTFTNKSGSNSQWTNDEGYTTNTGTTTASNTQTFTNKSGSNSQWTNDEGYTTAAGTVTSSGGANERLAVFSSATNIGGSDDVMWDGVNFAITAASTITALTIDANVEEGPAPRITFKQASVESGMISVNKDAHFNFYTFDGTSLKRRLFIDGKFGNLTFDAYESTSEATTGSLSPNQNFQALSQDTLANLGVDPGGNVVRGSQEGTWTFTKAQLDALTTGTTSGTTLIDAPGANKAVIVEESNWMIRYSGTGSMSSNGFEIRQGHNGDSSAGITRIPSGQINTIMSSAPTNPTYGFYSRDLPQYNNDGRSFVTNKATFITRITTNATPANLVSISIKLKYRLFNANTF